MSVGDRLRRVFGRVPRTFDEPRTAEFSGYSGFRIPQLLSELARRRGVGATREAALEVPAVLRGRNLICGIGTLPLQAVDADNNVARHELLLQPDPNVPRCVTLAMTVEDLLFDAVAWWRVTGFDADLMPAQAVRYEPGRVKINPPPGFDPSRLPSGLSPTGVVWMDGEPVPHDQVIRFDSPNPAVLVAGRKAITRALALGDAAALFAENPRMRGYFTPKDKLADPGSDEKIRAALDDWAEARRERVDGYVPAALDYTTVQDPTPADLQLIQMQEQAVKDLANVLGIDAEELGVSTTSRTYANIVDRRKDKINDTLAPYMLAITDRLSMPDVTPPGVAVRFNLDDYLRADPKTRAEVQEIYVSMGVTDASEVRAEEGKPPRDIAPVAPPVEVRASGPAAVTFARGAGLTFDYDPDATFAVDTTARTITGLAVPYGQVARSSGQLFRFASGSIKYSAVNRVKLLRDHDPSQAIGVATRLDDTAAGLVATFRVSPGARGDEALALAVDGVLDGLSIGVDFRREDFGPDPDHAGAQLVQRAALREVSLTPVPAFDDSRLTSVTASRQGGTPMPCASCGQVHADGVTACTPTTGPATEPAAAAPAAPVTFSADQFAAFMAQWNGPAGASPAAAAGGVVRPTVNPSRPVAGTQVREALPYQFSRVDTGLYRFSSETEHDFSTDLIGMFNLQQTGRDYSAELGRLNGFVRRSFADVEIADLPGSLVSERRPDMWVPQRDYATPLWDLTGRGPTPNGGQKFDIPKFTSSSGLVAVATEKTEPAGGSFVDELQTITPGQLWGKVEITRQVWRQGGNPAFSGILWAQMLREFYEDREAAIATFLGTLTAAADIALTATDASPSNDEYQATMESYEQAIADLQFARGGNRFEAFAVHQALFRVGARVKDDAGRPLYPMINPQNANGTTERRYATIDVAGTTWVPAYALGTPAAASTNSWLFDPAVVLAWAGAPERLFWDFGATVQTANIPQLSFVTVGLYADYATANTDITGVRQVTFDPNSEA